MLSPGMIYGDDQRSLRRNHRRTDHLAFRVGRALRPLHPARNVRCTHEDLWLVGFREGCVTSTYSHGESAGCDGFNPNDPPSSFVKTCLASKSRMRPDDNGDLRRSGPGTS